MLVFEDPTPNAFALPGGKIGVHTGMLEVASTPGRLAAVVGHEVAHVLLRHGNERLSQALVAESIASAGTIAVGVKAPRYQELVSLGLGLGVPFGVLLPFSRKHEKEADYIGQLFMAKAGFSSEEWRSVNSVTGMASAVRRPSCGAQTRIPDFAIMEHAQRCFEGSCSVCNGPGPIDVHLSRRCPNAPRLSFRSPLAWTWRSEEPRPCLGINERA